jgi:ferredoxin-nitrite reductase
MGNPCCRAAPEDEIDWDKRDHIGVHAQKQQGLNFVGLHVPVGRLMADPDLFDLGRLAEVYGNGEIRLTVEQNVIIPNVLIPAWMPAQRTSAGQLFLSSQP